MSNEIPILKDTTARRFSRRELAQSLVSGLAAGLFAPALSPLHPVHKHLLDGILPDSADAALADESYRPAFLSAAHLASSDKLSEAIVPGAHRALCAQFMDLLLGVDTAEHQQEFLASLSAMEAAAAKIFRKDIRSLNQTELHQLLEAASTTDSAEYHHFENLKGWTAGTYYSSEIGMRELGWTPDRVFPSYPVCSHTEIHS